MRRPVVIFFALGLACGGSSKAPRKLVLLHTNDEHSHLIGLGPEVDDFPAPAAPGSGVKGGASRRASVLKTERDAATAAGAESLTVSAGDNMMGTLAQIAATTISADYRVMKVLGYDLTTLGNHEFDYGPNGLALAIDAANADVPGLPKGLPPIVASNIHFSGTAGDNLLAAKYDALNSDPSKPIHGKYVITTPGGLKVGFIGIMGADAAAVAPAAAPVTFSVAAGTTSSNQIAALAQIYDDVQPIVNSLRRDDKVDLVVALSHGGADAANPSKSEDLAIAQNVTGLDVIVSGHSHTDFPATLVTNRYDGRSVLVQQAGRFGDTVGRISLTVNGDRSITFDTAGSKLVAVTDAVSPADTTINTIVGTTIAALEQQNIPGQSFSFLQYTLAEILGAAPPAPTGTGSYYNFPLVQLPFDVDNAGKLQETELIDLSADAQLAAANLVKPTELAVEAAGVVRTPALRKGKTARLGFADLFTAVPLGGSPPPNGTGTPGYPLCRFGIYLAEVKAAFEVTAGYAYTGHDDLFVVPAGFRFQYDLSRPAFNSNGDPLDPANGRVAKMWQLTPAALLAGTYDGDANYEVVFDASLDAAHSLPGHPGWAPSARGNPLRLVRAAASLYIATFATFAGVKLKALHDTMPNLADGAPVPGNDPTLTILKRPDNTEIKQWEALGGYVHALGTMPARYDKNDAATVLPRRAICVGATAVNGNCSH